MAVGEGDGVGSGTSVAIGGDREGVEVWLVQAPSNNTIKQTIL
jgi:hypothetical protein